MTLVKSAGFFFVCLLILIRADNAAAISMHCASVGANGQVTVTWDLQGTNAPNYVSWYVYHSTSGAGPFTAIDSIFFYTDTFYTHASANAGNNPAYYFTAFISSSGAVIYSDTIRAIGLNINNPGNGFANLSWNATHYPLLSSSLPWYYIYREYPPGILTVIDSVDARTAPVPMTFNDTVTVCSDTLKYVIEVRDSSGCSSFSMLKGDLFVDRIAPGIPVIDSVSVDASGNAIVSWLMNPAGDTRAYVILHNPGHVAIDTVYGRGTTTVNTTISAVNASEPFEVLAIDSCNNPTAPAIFHSTIYLRATFERCAVAGLLNWSAYDFWGQPPLYYIYVSINGAAEILVDSTSSTFYTDTNLVSGSVFCYRIRAKETGGIRTTTSNRACITPSFPPPPAFSYIRKVTVTGPNTIMIVAYVDPAAQVRGYELHRSDNQSGPFSTISSVAVNGVSTLTFFDNVPTDMGPYYYQVTTIDSCGNTVKNSQVSHSILLDGTSGAEFINNLLWNDYASWPAGVDRYNLYRSINGVLVPVPFAVVFAGGINVYSDSVLGNYNSNGEFCYVVEAVESQGNPYFLPRQQQVQRSMFKTRAGNFYSQCFSPRRSPE